MIVYVNYLQLNNQARERNARLGTRMIEEIYPALKYTGKTRGTFLKGCQMGSYHRMFCIKYQISADG